MDIEFSFGRWLQKRRKALDLTREALAARAGCSVSALRKIEADERRPSRQLAILLAEGLKIPPEDLASFLQVARGEHAVDRLRLPVPLAPIDQISPFPTQTPKTLQQGSENRARRSTLPVPPTSLIGRKEELADLEEMLKDPECRIITLVGPGGIGKTHLAIEAAANQIQFFEDGVQFVELASVNSIKKIVQAVSDSLGLSLYGPEKPETQLLNYLQEKQILLLLDNAEHLIEGLNLFGEILQYSPRVKLLFTSREQSNLRGEWVYRLAGLSVPVDAQVEDFEAYGAVALFLLRARQVQAGFAYSADDRRAIAQICQLVDGIPLAIELAASWVRLLSLQEIAEEIEHSKDFLSAFVRDLPERQHSMRAVFEHSWRLLSGEEQDALRKLSVFQGGFTREAGARVAGASLPTLSALLAKSLIIRQGESRFDLHELIRQYTQEKLRGDPGALQLAEREHSSYFIDLLTRLHPAIRGPQMGAALNTIQADLKNIRAAWLYKINGGELGDLRQAEKSLYDYYELRGRYLEGYAVMASTAEAFRKAVDRNPESVELRTNFGLVLSDQSFFGLHSKELSHVKDLARQSIECLRSGDDLSAFGYALLWLSQIEYVQGYLAEAEKLAGESLAVFIQCDDERGVATTLTSQAKYALVTLRFEEGRQAAERAEAIYQRHGEVSGVARSLNHLAESALLTGSYPEARALLLKSLSLSRAANISVVEGDALRIMAQVAYSQGDLIQAQQLLEESLVFLSEREVLPNRLLGMARLGGLVAARGDLSRARQLLSESLNSLAQLQHIPAALEALVDLARLLSLNGSPEKAMEFILFVRNEPRVRPITSRYAELLCTELEPALAAGQVAAASASAGEMTFESALEDSLRLIGAGELGLPESR